MTPRTREEVIERAVSRFAVEKAYWRAVGRVYSAWSKNAPCAFRLTIQEQRQ